MPALLAGLEHQQHVAAELVAPVEQQARRAEQHGHVRVVAAGVHRVAGLRRELEPGVLVEGQAVHVAAQQDGGRGMGCLGRATVSALAPRFVPSMTAVTDPTDVPRRRRQPHPLELRHHERLGPGQLQPDLGASVERAASRDDFGEEGLSGGEEGRETILVCDHHLSMAP